MEFLNYTTENVVYIIFNKISNNFYIGETSRRFKERIIEHLKNVGKKEMKLNVMTENLLITFFIFNFKKM